MIDPTLNAESMSYTGNNPVRLNMTGPQIWGIPNAEQQARIDAGEELEYMWHGEMQMAWWGMYETPHEFCRGLRRAFPKLRILRVPFNKHYWTRDGNGKLNMHWTMEEFFKECAVNLSNFQICWDFHDGPTQMLQDPKRHQMWPNSYPVDIKTFEDWDAASIYLGQRQVETWNMLFEWLADRPYLQRQTIGYELMNEPAAYEHGYKLFRGGTPPAGLTWEQYFVKKFVDHNQAMVNVINHHDTGKFILAPTWAYNGQVDILEDTILPNGDRGTTAFRKMLGNRIIWSIHYYVGFDAQVATQDAHDRVILGKWGPLKSDPVCVTEMNVHGEAHNPARQGQGYRHFWRLRHTNWLSPDVAGWDNKKWWGLSWWPTVNWAQASSIRIAVGSDEPVIQRRFSTAGAIHHYALGNHPHWFTGPQSGVKGWEPHVIRQNNSMDPAHWELDGWHLLADLDIPNRFVSKNLLGWLVSYGGAGTTFHDCSAYDGDYTLQVEGGDGKTVIHAHNNRQYQYHNFHLGRGGGVVRLGHGSHIVMSKGGPATVYTYEADVDNPPETEQEQYGYYKNRGHAVVSFPYGWNNKLICAPTSVTQLDGFDPNRGDRLSFMGAFPTIQSMRAAMMVVQNNAAIKGVDIYIDLPGGGRLHMIDAGAYANRLHDYVLDFTDGWYADGWTEPVDYTEAEFTNPIPIVPPPPVDAENTRWFDRNGSPVSVVDKGGRVVGQSYLGMSS